MREPRRLLCVVLALIAGWRHGAGATEADQPPPSIPTIQSLHRRLKVSLGYHFSSGDYGTADTTEIGYVPLIVTGEISRWALQLTVPYLRISGPPGVIEGPAGPIATDGDADGLGDLFARASYLLPRKSSWPPWVPFVGLVGLVKFPTASRNDGLGTGEFDFGIESELTWAFGRLTPFGTFGYRFLGDPPRTSLRNVAVVTAGGAYQILPALGAGLFVDYREASSISTGQRLDLVPFASWKFIPPWALDLYASAGLLDGSPAAGVGTQLSYSW